MVGGLLYPSSTKRLRQRCGNPEYERFQERDDVNSSLNHVQLSHVIHKPAEFVEWLADYCRSHLDLHITLGGNGVRKSGNGTIPFMLKHVSGLCLASLGECLRAATANAAMVKHGEALARKCLENVGIPARTLPDAQRWLEKHTGCYHLRKDDHIILTELSSWLEEFADGVCLLHLVFRGYFEE